MMRTSSKLSLKTRLAGLPERFVQLVSFLLMENTDAEVNVLWAELIGLTLNTDMYNFHSSEHYQFVKFNNNVHQRSTLSF